MNTTTQNCSAPVVLSYPNRNGPVLLSYLRTGTDHEGQPCSFNGCALLMNEADATRLLERWNLEGKRMGYAYSEKSRTHYRGNLKETAWLHTGNGIQYALVEGAA